MFWSEVMEVGRRVDNSRNDSENVKTIKQKSVDDLTVAMIWDVVKMQILFPLGCGELYGLEGGRM